MRNKLAALLLTLTALVGIPVLTAPAALADGPLHDSCSAGAWNFNFDVSTYHNSTGGVYFNSGARIGYFLPQYTGLEWRIRIFKYGNSYPSWDGGYQTNPNINFSMTAIGGVWDGNYYILWNAGRLNDGLPTCQGTIAIPNN